MRSLRLAKRMILFCFLVVYLSYIVFFDLRILTARLGISTPPLGDLLLIWGIILAPFIATFSLFIKLTKRTALLLALWSLYAIIGVVIGLAMGNPVEDLLGDLFKAFFIPAGVGLYFMYKVEGQLVEGMLYWIGAFFVLTRTAIFAVAFGSITRLYFGTSMDAIMICLAIRRLSARPVQRARHSASRAAHYLVIAAALIGQKRALLISFLTYVGHRRVLTLALLSSISLAVLLSMDTVDWRSVPFVGRYLSLTDLQFIMENQSRRIVEVVAAYSAWTSGLGPFVFGHGFGAQIFVYSAQQDYAEALHSLHNTPAAVLYRSGVFGIVFLAYLLQVAVRDILVGGKSDGAIILALFLTSLFIFSFIDEVFVGYYAARILDSRQQSAWKRQ